MDSLLSDFPFRRTVETSTTKIYNCQRLFGIRCVIDIIENISFQKYSRQCRSSYKILFIFAFHIFFQVTDKQRVSNWDILEGMKNPAPLSWAWFGAVRLERKPLTCEDNHRLLKYHTHNLQRPVSTYLDPPPLPPEDLEPIPDKPVSVALFYCFFFYLKMNPVCLYLCYSTFFHKCLTYI